MNAQERIARANRLDEERNGRHSHHCLECGKLHCDGHVAIPAQRDDADERLSA